MQVTYVSLNGAHHYIYARALARAGILRRFICGLSRFSPRAPLPEVGDKLLRADHVHNFYLASLRLHFPAVISEEVIYRSKRWLDVLARKDALQSDLFLCYNGTGLGTMEALRSTPTRCVVEAVNSHVLVQEKILREEHQLLGLPLQGFHRREIARRVREFELADGIICPSTFVRRSFLEQGIPEARLRTVPFGVGYSTRPQPETAEKPTGTFRVLFVGQINLRKGLRYLFQAFEKFQHPAKELWIVGPWTEQTGIEDLTPPAGTQFLGILKGAELEHAYRSCQVFVLPTLEEGLALVIGEALSHGLPVIATVNSGAEDLFQDGSVGFIVPIRDPEGITRKLQLLADDPARLEQMSALTRVPGTGLPTWEQACEHLIAALRDFQRMPRNE